MNAEVLRENGIQCSETFPAQLLGYSLTIRPRVNLIPSENSCCYGGLAFVDQEELRDLYDGVYERYGQRYFPYPVMGLLEKGKSKQAICFISEPFDLGAPEALYINEMVQCAMEVNAPKNYIEHIQSFLVTPDI